MSSPHTTALMGAIVCPLSIILTTHTALAGGATATSTTSTLNPLPTGSTTPTTSTSSEVVNPIQVQQFSNWSGSSSLVPPNCNSGCTYAVARVSPSTYGSSAPNLEVMVGVTLTFGASDGGAAELNRLNGEMNKYRTEHEIRLALSEKLAAAIEEGKIERARIIAMNLAPMLGYKDYRLLLAEVSNPKSISNDPKLGTSQISLPPVMF
jgi:hypothetical protein